MDSKKQWRNNMRMLVVSLIISIVFTVVVAIGVIAVWIAIGPGLVLLKAVLAGLIIVGVSQTVYFITRLVAQNKENKIKGC
jgi:hypothetical protein